MRRDVYSLVRFFIMTLVSMGVWIAIGLGVGFVWHWLVSSIDLGMDTLTGVVALGGCFMWLSRISTSEALYGDDAIELSDSTSSTTSRSEPRPARRRHRRRRS